MYIDGAPDFSMRSNIPTTRGKFLILFSDPTEKYINGYPIIYGCVRNAVLKKTNEEWVGKVSIGRARIEVNGTFGNKGKPISLDKVKFKDGNVYRVHAWFPKRLYEFIRKFPEELSKQIWDEINGISKRGESGPTIRELSRRFYDYLGPQYWGPK